MIRGNYAQNYLSHRKTDGLWLACTYVNQAPYWVDPDSDSCFETNVTSITEALKPSAEVKWSVANSKLNITSS